MPWTANPLRAGSIPAPASIFSYNTGIFVNIRLPQELDYASEFLQSQVLKKRSILKVCEHFLGSDFVKSTSRIEFLEKSIKSLAYGLCLLFLLFSTGVQAQPNDNSSFYTFHNELVDAADRGDEAEVRRLLRSDNLIDSRGDFGVTALMRASLKGHEEVVELLIQSGADTDAVDLGGATALHLAARQGNESIVALLLKSDAMVDVPDNEGWTPLMRASIAKKKSLIPFLLKSGASLVKRNNLNDNALTLAIKSADKETVSLLVNTPDFTKLPIAEKEKLSKLALKKNNPDIAALFYTPPPVPLKQAAPVVIPKAAPVAVVDKPAFSFFGWFRNPPHEDAKPVPVKQKPIVADETEIQSVSIKPVTVTSAPIAAPVLPAKNAKQASPVPIIMPKPVSADKKTAVAPAVVGKAPLPAVKEVPHVVTVPMAKSALPVKEPLAPMPPVTVKKIAEPSPVASNPISYIPPKTVQQKPLPPLKAAARIEVAEAIRVPIGESVVVNPEPVYLPSSSKEIKKTLWLQLGSYASEAEAMAAFEAIKSNHSAEGVRVRVISALQQQDTSVSLRLGPVTEQDAEMLCALMKSDKVTCAVVRDFGKSTVISAKPGGYSSYVHPENRENPAIRKIGKYWVQFGTFESETAAESQRNALKSSYPALKPLSFAISAPRAGSNQNAAFRLRGGVFRSYEDASALCDSLASKGVDCIAVNE